MPRTGMIARGLRAAHRMASGDSTVYVLAKSTGADLHTSLGSTESAHIEAAEEGTAVLHITEDASLTATVLRRAAAFAIASGASGYRIWRRLDGAQPAYAQNARDWSFQIAPTGVVFTLATLRLLESGVTRLLESGVERRLEA